MANKKYEKILKKLADKHGTTVDEIKKQSEIAINIAWDNPSQSVIKIQQKFFPNGKPQLDEFFDIIANNYFDKNLFK